MYFLFLYWFNFFKGQERASFRHFSYLNLNTILFWKSDKSNFKRGQILQIKSIHAEINPPLYTLVDLQGEKYGAYYYSWQLTKTSKPNYKKDFFLVEKVLDEKIEKGVKYLKVKYLYYGPKFNQWVPASNIQSGSSK